MTIKKKKILVFYARDNQTLTGGPRTIISLFNEVHSECISLTFMAPSNNIITETLSQKGFPIKLQPLPKLLARTGGKFFSFSITNKVVSFFSTIRYNLDAKKIIQAEDFDCIWARNIKSVMLIALASALSQKPLIWDIALERKVNPMLWPIYFLGLVLSSVVVTEGNSQPREIFGHHLYTIFKKKFKAILPGISLDREDKIRNFINVERAKEKQYSTFNLLNIATVNERKNQKFLLEIVKELSNNGVAVHLDILGSIDDRNYYSECRNFIRNNNLEEQIIFHGWQDRVEKFISKSQLLIITSKNEGIPHAIYEAMHAGLAVVATPVGGIADVIKHEETGWLIKDLSAQQAAIQIKEYLSNSGLREKVVQDAQEYAQEMLVIRRWAKDYSSLFSDLVHSH